MNIVMVTCAVLCVRARRPAGARGGPPGAGRHLAPPGEAPPTAPQGLACMFLARSDIITLLATRANTAHGAAFTFMYVHAC